MTNERNTPIDYRRLSKFTARVLRHEPWLYELELDDQGWVPLEEFLSAVRGRKGWHEAGESDLRHMVDVSDKKRYEIADGRIRAFYGHSVPRRLIKQPAEPPAALHHGTAPEVVGEIRADGLRPMGRQFVHLSSDAETARQVGRRKARSPVILEIQRGRRTSPVSGSIAGTTWSGSPTMSHRGSSPFLDRATHPHVWPGRRSRRSRRGETPPGREGARVTLEMRSENGQVPVTRLTEGWPSG
jgi:putative RNA 2'-phosphotransferase